MNRDERGRVFGARLARYALAALLLSAALAHGPTAARAAVPRGFIHQVLPNGLEVSILPDSSYPIVSTRVWYHVGAANEDAGTRGFAHLFEHLMFGGTATLDRGKYEEHHHRHGGYENAHTSWDETTYESDIPAPAHHRVLEMEADRMVHLRLDQDNLDNEKRIVTEELRLRIENDPMDRVQVKALAAVLGRHPYAVTPLGTKEEIAAATLERARGFYARYYRPRNAHLVVVGPVDGPATLDEVKRLFGPLPADGATPPDIPPLLGWKCPPEVSLEEDLPPVHVALLVLAMPPETAIDATAVLVLREMLAGGYANPYREDLVMHRRKALYAEPIALGLRRGGILAFSSAVFPHRTRAGQFRVMEETLRNLGQKQWLTERSLEAVKHRLIRRMKNADYFAARRADTIARERWWSGDIARAFDLADRVDAVTRADVARAFDRYIGGATPVRVYIRPEKVALWMRLFGWLLPLFVPGG